MKKISIVIPVYNENENLSQLLNEITHHIEDIYEHEIIFIDDGSTDKSKLLLENFKKNSNIRIHYNIINKGQSFSLFTGIKLASHNTIVTIDGDCQNNPKDIPKLVDLFFNNNKIDLIGGIRIDRKDNFIKKISSLIANKVRSFILNDNCPDTGCSLKVFKKDIFLQFPYFDRIHRFLPALFKGYGYSTDFIPVDHRLREKGYSKYGTLKRLFQGIFDLIRVIIIIRGYKRNLND